MKKIIIFIILVVVLVGYIIFSPQQETEPTLSIDRTSILVEGDTVLAVDDDAIINWFKTESQVCDASCEDKTSFRNQTRFSSIIISPDTTKIGFTIESDILSPDTVAGIFSRTQNKIAFLTSYYLGNEFLGFSPGGTNFIYQGNCFEAMCGLFIKDSETLAEKASINNPQFTDARTQNATFVKWISDNEVEYSLDSINSPNTELKRARF